MASQVEAKSNIKNCSIIGGVLSAAPGIVANLLGWTVSPIIFVTVPLAGALVGAGVGALDRGVDKTEKIISETASRTGEYVQNYVFPLLASAYMGYVGNLFTKQYLGICETFFSNPNCTATAITGIAAVVGAVSLGLTTAWSIICNSCEGKELDSKKHELELIKQNFEIARLKAKSVDEEVTRAVNLENKEIHRHDVSTAVRATGWTIGTIGLAGLYSSAAIGLGLVSAPVTATAALGYSVPVVVGGLGTALKGEKMYENEKKLAQVEKDIRKKN